MSGRNVKDTLSVLQASSLRELVETVNSVNRLPSSGTEYSQPILREDIVDILKEDGTYFLLYFR